MEIDIRSENAEQVQIIRFDDYDENYYNAAYLLNSYNQVKICHNSDYSEKQLSLLSKESAENLIKALQKAIELDWWTK